MSPATTIASAVPHIAVVVSSTRAPRLGPGIANYVYDFLDQKARAENVNVRVELLDIAKQGLPLYDEPAVPGHLPKDDPTPHYQHQHTRAWSAKISKFDAFVFVTPQYNWSVPAALKNALDYLFHEWAQKPGAIVSYGAKGGPKGAAHLRQIMMGLRMRPVLTDTTVKITDEHLIDTYIKTGIIPTQTILQWRESGVDETLGKAWDEILVALQQPA